MKKKILPNNIATALLLGTSVGMAGSAYSQNMIEEVIVTANKRSESLSDVGMSIGVLSTDTLKTKRISSFSDIAVATPGLSFAQTDTNTPILTLRGIGFNDNSLAVYPAVSAYIDEAPLTFPVLGGLTTFDLERIEVLKGPQGTLFGQNSTGGAINYIAAKPTEEFAAGFDISYGRFNLKEIEGYVSGPLTDELKARLAIKSHQMDGWQKSITRNDENAEEDYFAGRLIVEWEPTESTRFSLNLNGWSDDTEPQALQLAIVNPAQPTYAPPQLVNAPFADSEPRQADWSSVFPPESDRDFFQGILRAEFNVTENVLLTSLTSYIDFEQFQNLDWDGAAISTGERINSTGEVETFSQEIRLENTNSDKIRWVAGANYEKSSTNEDATFYYPDGSTAFNPFLFFLEQGSVKIANEMENKAIFGNVDYSLTENLTLKAGARYTESEFLTEICSYDTGDGKINGLFSVLGAAFSGINSPLGQGDCFTLDDNLVSSGVPFNDTLKEENVSWRVGLDYGLNEDTLLYGNISKGYKAGSYPYIAASTFVQYEPVTQESVLAYEVGIKASSMEGRLAVNAAVFYYEYEDKQVRGKILDPTFVILDLLRNIPESEILGTEFDLTVIPVDGLTLSVAATYIDSEITKSPPGAVNALSQPDDFTGDSLPFTSKWQAAFNLDYEWELSSGVKPFLGLTYNYQSEFEAVLGGASIYLPDSPSIRSVTGDKPPYLLGEYGTLDLRAGISAVDDSWRVMVWGKNVTDEYYVTNVVPANDATGRFVGRTATYGITVSYDF